MKTGTATNALLEALQLIKQEETQSMTIKFQVGHRVYNKHQHERGTITAIHGEQSPDTCDNISGSLFTGGGADFDIILDDGTQILRLPESFVRESYAWEALIDEPRADELELARLKKKVADRKAEEQKQKEIAAAAYQADKDKLKAERTDMLIVADTTWDDLVVGAKNIRTELKQAFPGIKFSVKTERFSGGDSIDVRWTDGPTTKKVDEIISKYQAWSFDAMTDSSSYNPSPWTDLFGEARFVKSNRNYSDDMVAKAIEIVVKKWAGPDDEVPTVDDYRKGNTHYLRRKSDGFSYGQEIYREMVQIDCTDAQDQEPEEAVSVEQEPVISEQKAPESEQELPNCERKAPDIEQETPNCEHKRVLSTGKKQFICRDCKASV